MKVVHVGMGKTGTSSLQTHVFPLMEQMTEVGVYNPRELSLRLDMAVNGFVAEESLGDLVARHDRLFLSNETLMEWDPEVWETAADRLLHIFGPDTTILMTLRDPKSYLRSLYQQALHAGKIRPPEDFFLPSDVYDCVRRFVLPGEMHVVNIDAFDMVHMVQLYLDRFSSVVLVPFEALDALPFLTEIWSLSDTDHARFCQILKASPRINTSYTRLAVRLTLGREWLLNGMGGRSRSATDRQFDIGLAYGRGTSPAPAHRGLPSWSKLMRLLSRYGPQTRYQLPEGLYLGRHMQRNAAFYAALRAVAPGCLHFRDGRAAGLDLAAFRAAPIEASVDVR